MIDSKLHNRIIEISYGKNLSHIGSCLTAYPIIDDIYQIKSNNDIFVLSSGHAGLALYVVLEKYYSMQRGYYGVDANELFKKHGVHPNRDLEHGILCSSGSLGHGLPIALGMALADKKRNVYCLISDGECAEGSIWEALRIKTSLKLENLKVHVNINGWGAYDQIDSDLLIKRLIAFDPTINIHKTTLPSWEFISDPQEYHYHALKNEEEYAKAIL